MASYLDTFYQRSPILLQNVMASSYGLKERFVRYGGRYQEYCRDLDRSQWWTIDELQEYQNSQLRSLVAFCYVQIPYYRELFDSLGLQPGNILTVEDLSKLPILEKETVRAQPERFVPRRLSERLISQTTGGTTGTPLRYFATPSAVQYNYATYEARFRKWAGVKLGDRLASINGKPIVPISQSTAPFWRHNIAFNQLYLSAYHLSYGNLPAYVRQLRRFDPQVIVSYVSTIHAIARFIIDSGCVGIIRPKAVLVSSETLFNWIRADIETAFECKVFNGYSLGELVAFISECEAGSLHISPEYGVVECIDHQGHYDLICTGLFNYAMPLLRYRTGDLVEMESGRVCSCGRHLPVVKSILGRVDDQIVTPEGSVIGSAPLSLAFQSVPNLREAQILQDHPEKIVIHLVVDGEFTAANERLLLSELHKRLGHSLDIKLVYVTSIARTVGGKQRLIISNCAKHQPSSVHQYV